MCLGLLLLSATLIEFDKGLQWNAWRNVILLLLVMIVEEFKRVSGLRSLVNL